MLLSIIIVIISLYTTLILVKRIQDRLRSNKLAWILAAAFVMTTGIFSMHFIATIGHYYFASSITYNISQLILSFLCGFVSMFIALCLINSTIITKVKLYVAGIAFTAGILFLHIIALFAVNGANGIKYASVYFFLSILLSFGFGIMEVYVLIKIRNKPNTTISMQTIDSVLLGLVVSLFHFIGIKATQPIHFDESQHLNSGMNTIMLVIVLSFISFLNIIIALLIAYLDNRALKNERLLLKQVKESEERYRILVEQSPEPIVVHDGHVVLYVNEVCVKNIGASHKNELIGKDLWKFLHPKYREISETRIRNLLEGEKIKFEEQQLIALDGRIIDVEMTGVKVRYDNHDAYQIVIRDLTEKKKAEKELAESKQRYQSLFEHNPDSVFSVDCEGFFQEVNSSIQKILGYSKDELLQMSVRDVIDSHSLDLAIEEFHKALQGSPRSHHLLAITKSGDKIPVSLTNIPIIVDGEIKGVFGIGKDMSKEKEQLEKIKQLAYTDALTGLPNRTWFYKYLQETLNRANNTASQSHSIAILNIDFDNFKNVNDSFGHHIGDVFLKQISNRLKKCVRKHDVISRIGGDEFILIAENVSQEEAGELAEKIINEMNHPITIMGNEIMVTLSIGISIHSDFSVDVETLIKQADFAMYLAKEKGKNNYQFFNEKLNEKITRRLLLENSLHKALEQNELTLHYQPQVDIQNGKLVGLEALIRWVPSFGPVPPNEFIPIAEDTGLIIPIGEWVMREACRKIKQWEEHESLNVPIAVNVSARQFADHTFADKVKQIIKEENINPHYLELEITESVMLNTEESIEIIQELRDIGVKFAIDDFGTGYSSLSVISNLAYDTLKIDKSLIDDAIQNARKMKILKAILEVTSRFNRIVIEGIETKEQVEALQQFPAVGQGYYFGHPVLPEQLIDYVNR
jgi:diguanylate cyclase